MPVQKMVWKRTHHQVSGPRKGEKGEGKRDKVERDGTEGRRGGWDRR